MKWIKDGLSLDETRISALIIAFFVTLGFALYQVVRIGDVSDNLLMLLAYELAAFTGIKVAEQFSPAQKEITYSNSSNDPPKLP